MKELPYPPRISVATEPFWEGLRNNQLKTTYCRDCDWLTFPPKIVCPQCLHAHSLEWKVLSGVGTLESFTEVWAAPAYFEKEIPYVLGIVRLKEKLRMLARIAGTFEQLTVGKEVEICFDDTLPTRSYHFIVVSE